MSPVQLSLLLAGGSFVAGLFDPVYFLGMVLFLALAAIVPLARRKPQLDRLLAEDEDLTQLAIDRLRGLGTEHGTSLAAEIERGRARQWDE